MNISDEQLIALFSEKVILERKHAAELIELISEIDRRRLYLKLDFTSLFDFLTKKFGYTPGSAQRRIDAARLLGEIPEVGNDLKSGELNLMQISTLARSVRVKQKSAPVSSEQKREILEVIRNQDLKSSELKICQALDIEPKLEEKVRVQKNESVRYEITFTKEQASIIEQAKSAVSHVLPNPSMAELFVYLAKHVLIKKGLMEKKPKKSNSTANVASKRSISRPIRRAIFQRDQCCQWRDKKTGRLCGSKFQWQVDHIRSLWANGDSKIENLQILCGAHNRLKYNREAGVKMKPTPEASPARLGNFPLQSKD